VAVGPTGQTIAVNPARCSLKAAAPLIATGDRDPVDST